MIPPRRARLDVIKVMEATPKAKINTKTNCHVSPTTLVRGARRDRRSAIACSGWWSAPLPCKAITIAPAMKPMISAERGGRVICRLLSILAGRCKRIVRLHYQIAQKLVRRIDRCATQNESFLTGIFLNEIESELVILKEMRAKFRHCHAFGLGSFDQTRAGRVVEGNFDSMLMAKFIRKGAHTLVEGGFFLFMPFRHQTIKHPFRLLHEFLRNA